MGQFLPTEQVVHSRESHPKLAKAGDFSPIWKSSPKDLPLDFCHFTHLDICTTDVPFVLKVASFHVQTEHVVILLQAILHFFFLKKVATDLSMS